MKTAITLILSLFAIACSANEASSDAQKYLNDKIADWEKQYESCESLEKENGLPTPEVLEALGALDDQQLRELLNAKSHMAMERCTKSETATLNHAVLALVHDKNLPGSIKEDAREVGSMIHSISWFMYQTFENLPDDIKQRFAAEPFFEQPFDQFRVLEELGAL